MPGTMTARERWLAVVERGTPDRVPLYYRATEEAHEKLMAYTGCADMDELCERLHIDRMAGVGPRYVGPPIPEGEDLYGRRVEYFEYEGDIPQVHQQPPGQVRIRGADRG